MELVLFQTWWYKYRKKFDPDCDNFSSCVKDKWKPRCCTLIQFFSNDRKKNVFPVHLFPLAPMHKNLFLHLCICQDIREKNIRYMRYIIEKNKIYDFFFWYMFWFPCFVFVMYWFLCSFEINIWCQCFSSLRP